MAYRYNVVVYDTPGTFLYVPPENLAGVEIVVRGAGGGGASGERDNRNEDCRPGPGGGGGGCSVSPRMIRRDELPDDGVEVKVGFGGSGGASPANRAWNVGVPGTDSLFGNFVFAGGGGGGGRDERDDGTFVASLTAGGSSGYGMSIGGRGLHRNDVRRGVGGFLSGRWVKATEADTVNEAHMAGGGGGGGHGQGHIGEWKDVEDEETGEVIDEEWDQTNYPWRFGGSSNAVENTTASGSSGLGRRPHWETLQSGCGGNGSASEGVRGGNGGFPGGGGAGGSGGETSAGAGGNGANGCVTVIELFDEDM